MVNNYYLSGIYNAVRLPHLWCMKKLLFLALLAAGLLGCKKDQFKPEACPDIEVPYEVIELETGKPLWKYKKIVRGTDGTLQTVYVYPGKC